MDTNGHFVTVLATTFQGDTKSTVVVFNTRESNCLENPILEALVDAINATLLPPIPSGVQSSMLWEIEGETNTKISKNTFKDKLMFTVKQYNNIICRYVLS